MSKKPQAEKPSTALTQSIAGKELRSGLATTLDAGMDAAISALHGIPILGVIIGLSRAGHDVRKWLEFRKLIKFLDEISKISAEKRAAFTERLKNDGKIEEFGENILLLLDKLEDASKPSIIGRIMALHIDGFVDYNTAMRLCAMVSRCYASDLIFLKNFQPGVQRGGSTIAAMLAADGLLQQVGIDGGTFEDPESSGIVYDINEYGKILAHHCL